MSTPTSPERIVRDEPPPAPQVCETCGTPDFTQGMFPSNAAAWDALWEDRQGYVDELDERDDECARLEAERDALRAAIQAAEDELDGLCKIGRHDHSPGARLARIAAAAGVDREDTEQPQPETDEQRILRQLHALQRDAELYWQGYDDAKAGKPGRDVGAVIGEVEPAGQADEPQRPGQPGKTGGEGVGLREATGYDSPPSPLRPAGQVVPQPRCIHGKTEAHWFNHGDDDAYGGSYRCRGPMDTGQADEQRTGYVGRDGIERPVAAVIDEPGQVVPQQPTCEHGQGGPHHWNEEGTYSNGPGIECPGPVGQDTVGEQQQ